jgi:hypothetical protein
MVLTPLQMFRPDWDKVTVAKNAEGHGNVNQILFNNLKRAKLKLIGRSHLQTNG